MNLLLKCWLKFFNEELRNKFLKFPEERLDSLEDVDVLLYNKHQESEEEDLYNVALISGEILKSAVAGDLQSKIDKKLDKPEDGYANDMLTLTVDENNKLVSCWKHTNKSYCLKGSETVQTINGFNWSAPGALEMFVYNVSNSGTILNPSGSIYGNLNVQAGDDIIFMDDENGWNSFSAEQQIKDTELVEIVTYNQLKTKRNNKTLIPGKKYRIVDYVCTVNAETSESYGETQASSYGTFDIIVTALSENSLSENVSIAHHNLFIWQTDTYFLNCKVEAWLVKYSLDNDTTRFNWADTVNGKGVIYYMKDEWENECYYDFKHIKFKRYTGTFADYIELGSLTLYGQSNINGFNVNSTSLFMYTFSGYPSLLDVSLTGAARNNTITINDRTHSKYYTLSNVVMSVQWDCYNNYIDDCYNLTINGDINYNQFKDCRDIVIRTIQNVKANNCNGIVITDTYNSTFDNVSLCFLPAHANSCTFSNIIADSSILPGEYINNCVFNNLYSNISSEITTSDTVRINYSIFEFMTSNSSKYTKTSVILSGSIENRHFSNIITVEQPS